MAGFLFHWMVFYLIIQGDGAGDPFLSMSGHDSIGGLLSARFGEILSAAADWRHVAGDLMEVSERGLWEVKGRPVNGLSLRLVWLAEALVFLGSFLADFTRKTRRPAQRRRGASSS